MTENMIGSRRKPVEEPMQVSVQPLASMSAPVVAAGIEKHDHHFIMRTVVPDGQSDPSAGKFSASEIDAYISSYLSAGWKLVAVHLVQHDPKLGTAFAWFLVR